AGGTEHLLEDVQLLRRRVVGQQVLRGEVARREEGPAGQRMRRAHDGDELLLGERPPEPPAGGGGGGPRMGGRVRPGPRAGRRAGIGRRVASTTMRTSTSG